jgi:hypothetical protein
MAHSTKHFRIAAGKQNYLLTHPYPFCLEKKKGKTELPILGLQKVDRKALHLPKPYFNFSPTPGIASVVLKVLHLYQNAFL